MKYKFILTPEQQERCFKVNTYASGANERFLVQMTDELEEWVRGNHIGQFTAWDWGLEISPPFTIFVKFEREEHAAQFKLKFL